MCLTNSKTMHAPCAQVDLLMGTEEAMLQVMVLTL